MGVSIVMGGCFKMVGEKNMFTMENPMKMDDLGLPPVKWKPPCWPWVADCPGDSPGCVWFQLKPWL